MPTSTPTARRTLYAVLAFVILTGGGAAYSDWQQGRKDSETKAAQAKSDELSRCFSGYRLKYVDTPLARGLKELGRLGGDGTESVAYQEALEDLKPEELERLNRLARKDPDRFLRDCRRDDP